MMLSRSLLKQPWLPMRTDQENKPCFYSYLLVNISQWVELEGGTLSLMFFCLLWQTVFFPKQICKKYHVSVDLDWTLLQCKSDDEYGEMQEIIASRDLEHQSDAQWLASVYFKNSINRYWRIRRDSLWPTYPEFSAATCWCACFVTGWFLSILYMVQVGITQ